MTKQELQYKTLGSLSRGQRFLSGQGAVCEVVAHISYYTIKVKDVETNEEFEMDPRGRVRPVGLP